METFIAWFGFLLSIILLLVIARKNLWLALAVSAFTLGLFNLSPAQIWRVTCDTLTNTSVLLLAFAVGLIPIIGAAMEVSGLMDDLVDNFRMRKRLFLMFSPALIGMLPMPGGALLSAPIIEKGGKTVSDTKKAAVNIWFRHVLILIYPLGALLVTTKMAGLNLYAQILHLAPGFILMLMAGYLFLIRDIGGAIEHARSFNARKLAASLSVILGAPFLHFSLMTLFKGILLNEACLVIGVLASLFLAFYLGGIGKNAAKPILTKAKPWNFALIILGVFIFLNIFKASDTARLIAGITFSKSFLLAGVGFLLGFLTGRVDVPVSILLPIYFLKYTQDAMPPSEFSLMYFSVFMGYLISPVHPCVLVTLEYFNTGLKDFFKTLGFPVAAVLGMYFVLRLVVA